LRWTGRNIGRAVAGGAALLAYVTVLQPYRYAGPTVDAPYVDITDETPKLLFVVSNRTDVAFFNVTPVCSPELFDAHQNVSRGDIFTGKPLPFLGPGDTQPYRCAVTFGPDIVAGRVLLTLTHEVDPPVIGRLFGRWKQPRTWEFQMRRANDGTTRWVPSARAGGLTQRGD
jgi:hypothetical protein